MHITRDAVPLESAHNQRYTEACIYWETATHSAHTLSYTVTHREHTYLRKQLYTESAYAQRNSYTGNMHITQGHSHTQRDTPR